MVFPGTASASKSPPTLDVPVFVLDYISKSTGIYTAPLKDHLAQAGDLNMCLTRTFINSRNMFVVMFSGGMSSL